MAGAPRRAWVTRARPGALATARRLEDRGWEVLVDPLLAVRDLSPQVDLDGVDALAFTSLNGVAAFARLHPDRSLPVLAVGERTARAAREAGFNRVRSADGDVEALARLIVQTAPGAVLHPSALEPAGDLVGLLAAAGAPARRLAVYESVERDPDPATLAVLDKLDAVLLHSPRAARRLAANLASHPAPRLAAYGLSSAVAAPLAEAAGQGWIGSVAFAPRPDETALLDLLPP
ncbi:MAG: uroporphyrinogen-III synthase [Caulobacter sp.]|nr:uroporphyrinogen-III synthase [Caulobacter sp.]